MSGVFKFLGKSLQGKAYLKVAFVAVFFVLHFVVNVLFHISIMVHLSNI